jgi:hypothetical protein
MPNRHSFGTELPYSSRFAFMVSGSNVIGQMRARIDVIASAQAICWQLIAIHVKRMGLFYYVEQVWNENAR